MSKDPRLCDVVTAGEKEEVMVGEVWAKLLPLLLRKMTLSDWKDAFLYYLFLGIAGSFRNPLSFGLSILSYWSHLSSHAFNSCSAFIKIGVLLLEAMGLPCVHVCVLLRGVVCLQTPMISVWVEKC